MTSKWPYITIFCEMLNCTMLKRYSTVIVIILLTQYWQCIDTLNNVTYRKHLSLKRALLQANSRAADEWGTAGRVKKGGTISTGSAQTPTYIFSVF